MVWTNLGAVAAGGALGAMARYGVALALPKTTFPWPTLAVNLAGSLLLGILIAYTVPQPRYAFLAVGFLGAFTTLSTFSVETMTLWQDSHYGIAVANVLANSIGGPLCAFIGFAVAARL